MYKLTKKFRFESAHRLAKGYKGKCSNIHGHSWNGIIEISCSTLNEQDLGVDFTELGKFCKNIEEKFDHKLILCKDDGQLINYCAKEEWKTVVLDKNPTCEAIAEYIYKMAINHFVSVPGVADVLSVRIEETCTTSCTYIRQ